MAEQDLEKLMEELQRKKAKISLLKEVKTHVETLQDPKGEKGKVEHKGVAKEIRELFEKFIDRAIDEVSAVGSATVPPSRTTPPQTEEGEEQPPQENKKNFKPKAPSDMIQFIQKYGKFSNKKVKAQSTSGHEITGIAREIQHPHVMVATDAGTYEPVLPETLELA